MGIMLPAWQVRAKEHEKHKKRRRAEGPRKPEIGKRAMDAWLSLRFPLLHFICPQNAKDPALRVLCDGWAVH
jgi:hypothetical protein